MSALNVDLFPLLEIYPCAVSNAMSLSEDAEMWSAEGNTASPKASTQSPVPTEVMKTPALPRLKIPAMRMLANSYQLFFPLWKNRTPCFSKMF